MRWLTPVEAKALAHVSGLTSTCNASMVNCNKTHAHCRSNHRA
ncbi:hypothetical protein KPSA1_04352 [Pseudomonas syringae pv. actinidiae]|uniref:Uncharacterized protein n=1 Tax=Pseudomonas syringae pv. actinidiae TaxID=103796 RepID=A0A2V0QDA9_PSESF|nr:hypothetical protein KPSA1_04352 [Pseudomonas syringae pv. actinidiae]